MIKKLLWPRFPRIFKNKIHESSRGHHFARKCYVVRISPPKIWMLNSELIPYSLLIRLTLLFIASIENGSIIIMKFYVQGCERDFAKKQYNKSQLTKQGSRCPSTSRRIGVVVFSNNEACDCIAHQRAVIFGDTRRSFLGTL